MNTTSDSHILVVDDDTRLRSLLEKFLSQYFIVSTAANAQEALQLLDGYQFDLAVMDIMMPDLSGLELIQQTPCPVLFLSALGTADQRITGLKVGADDYLVKPFEAEELLLRIEAILNRTNTGKENNVVFTGYVYNTDEKTLYKNSVSVHLSDNERSLIDVLCLHINQNVERLTLADQLGIEERSIDVQINRLRKKMPEAQIQSIRGVGYRLIP